MNIPEGWKLVPVIATSEMRMAIIHKTWREKWEAGKELQRKHGLDAVPPNTESEEAAGVWALMLAAVPPMDKAWSCERCHDSEEIEVTVGGGPDAYPQTVQCPACLPTPEPRDEREAFEKWWATEGGGAKGKTGFGDYSHDWAEASWQAALARPAGPSPEAVAVSRKALEAALEPHGTGPMMSGGDAQCQAGQFQGEWENGNYIFDEADFRAVILRAEKCDSYERPK